MRCEVKFFCLCIISFLVVVIILINSFGEKQEFDPENISSNGLEIYVEIPELSSPHVKINNPNAVGQKLKELNTDGKDSLQVILDFDRTISKYKSNGKITINSQGLLALLPSMPHAYVEGSAKLYARYGPIEMNTSMTVEEKIPYMEEWLNQYEKLLEHVPFDYNELMNTVVANNISLRDGVNDTFSCLHHNNIPTLVFSAGIGDIVDLILKYNDLKYSNVKVISNFFSLKNGHINGFLNQYIHPFNKNEHALQNTDYFKELTHRKNVILMGDSIGDATMADGIPSSGTVLKIGLLNSKIEESLPKYLSKFDIVVLDDQTMNIFNAILSYVL